MVIRLSGTTSTAGFSLIELLVVIAITSILSVGATLAFVKSDSDQARIMDDFLAESASLKRLSMLSGIDHALVVQTTGWQRERAVAGGGWEPIPENARDGIVLEIMSGATRQRIVFGRDGSIGPTGFVIGRGKKAIACRSPSGGMPRCAPM